VFPLSRACDYEIHTPMNEALTHFLFLTFLLYVVIFYLEKLPIFNEYL